MIPEPTTLDTYESICDLYMGGRHVQAKGYQLDCYKYNRAIELGWRVLRYSPQMLKNDPITVIQQIDKVLRG